MEYSSVRTESPFKSLMMIVSSLNIDRNQRKYLTKICLFPHSHLCSQLLTFFILLFTVVFVEISGIGDLISRVEYSVLESSSVVDISVLKTGLTVTNTTVVFTTVNEMAIGKNCH